MEVVPNSVDDLSTKFESVLSCREGGVQELLHQLRQNPNRTEVLKTSEQSSTSTCQHPAVVVNGVCNDCCQKIENEDSYGVAFSYLHKGLRLSRSEIHRLRCLESKKQLAQKKLHLVLDIDHTLVNSRRLEQASELLFVAKHYGMKEIDEFLVKLRPLVPEFLERASTIFEMHLYTLGSRSYAKNIAKILDPEGVYFDRRIISRDDNPDSSVNVKTLDLVLGEESNVLILDDKSQVWQSHLGNLILMKEFVFTGKDTDETEMNTPLNQISNVLHAIHSAYFSEQQELGGCKDVRKLAAKLRSTVLGGCKLYMKNVEDPKLGKMAEELGATLSMKLDPSVTHLVSCQKGTREYIWAVKHKKYSVHGAWIQEAYYLWERPSENSFHITKWKSKSRSISVHEIKPKKQHQIAEEKLP